MPKILEAIRRRSNEILVCNMRIYAKEIELDLSLVWCAGLHPASNPYNTASAFL